MNSSAGQSQSPQTLGIRCGHFISMAAGCAEPETDIYIGVSDGKIAEISPWSPEKAKIAKEFIDASAHVVIPGLVNTHGHLAMTLFRGLGDDLLFHKWLFERILPLEAELVDAEFVRIGTSLAALESIRFGVTAVADMYFFAETAADVIDKAGMRAMIAQCCASGPLPEDKVLGTDKMKLFEILHEKYKGHERIVASLGPHAPYTCDDALLREVARVSGRLSAPVQIHLAETKKEVEDSLKLHGKTSTQRLFDLGLLGPRTLCAHCVHLNEADTALMKKTDSKVAYNPDSNMKLGSGIAPITRYLKEGLTVGFGSDGAASNNDLSIFGAMDIGTKLQKLASGDNTAMVASDALACATCGGAKALGMQDRIGTLEVGKDADMILVDFSYPHMQPIYDVRSQLVYATGGLEVDTTICRGRVLMRKHVFQTLDSQKILAQATALSSKIRGAAMRYSAELA